MTADLLSITPLLMSDILEYKPYVFLFSVLISAYLVYKLTKYLINQSRKYKFMGESIGYIKIRQGDMLVFNPPESRKTTWISSSNCKLQTDIPIRIYRERYRYPNDLNNEEMPSEIIECNEELINYDDDKIVRIHEIHRYLDD